jgi:hypothetical protein
MAGLATSITGAATPQKRGWDSEEETFVLKQQQRERFVTRRLRTAVGKCVTCLWLSRPRKAELACLGKTV